MHPLDQTENIPHHTPMNHPCHIFRLRATPTQRNSETIPSKPPRLCISTDPSSARPPAPTQHRFSSDRPFFINFQAKDRYERDST